MDHNTGREAKVHWKEGQEGSLSVRHREDNGLGIRGGPEKDPLHG